jgi:hypothetical protein
VVHESIKKTSLISYVTLSCYSRFVRKNNLFAETQGTKRVNFVISMQADSRQPSPELMLFLCCLVELLAQHFSIRPQYCGLGPAEAAVGDNTMLSKMALPK